MAKVTRSASRSVYVASQPPVTGSMTAWALRDFVRALDAENIPDTATLTAHHDHNTRHLTGISVRHTVELPTMPPPQRVKSEDQE